MLRFMLELNNVDINICNKEMQTPIIYVLSSQLAITIDEQNCNFDHIIFLLLEKGADVNKKDINGRTVLYYICLLYSIHIKNRSYYCNKLKKVAEKILNSGAQILSDNNGETPIDILAKDPLCKDLANLFYNKGALRKSLEFDRLVKFINYDTLHLLLLLKRH